MSGRAGVGGGLPRRRNGKEQACEPCRKAKIACDHTLPACNRCKRRKISEKCVYLAAPMTHPADAIRRQSEPNMTNVGNLPLTPTTGSSATASPLTSFRPQDASPKPSSESRKFVKPGGFFGPTHFSAVFAENRENLGNDDLQIQNNDPDPHVPSSESLQSQTFLMLAGKEQPGSPRVALGVKVLRALPDRHTCNFLLDWYYEKNTDSRSYKLSIMAIANSLWTTFGRHLKERRTEDLEELSQIMCRNGETALEESEDYEKWLVAISGVNTRWESLGSIFGALTSALLSLPERDAFFATQRGDRNDRKFFAVEMKDCTQACITLSNYMDLLNILMVAVLSRNLIAQTVISGDTSLVVWRQLGDLVSATTALGLHRQMDTAQPISFLSEMKKYLFIVVFNVDKSASLLTGRPPALSYRYTRFELPLDLDDDIIIRGGDQLRKAIDALDANGWNTEGKLYPATRARAHGNLAIVLNEILELSLGDAAQCTTERIQSLIQRSEQTYLSFPSCIRFNGSDSSCSDYEYWTRLCIRLTMLEHRLLLERLAHKQGILDGQSMVDCAREMLELTVLVWVQRDRFVEHHCDYDWMLMCWGVPSCGVLCVELIKQMKQPPGSPHVLNLPRSEIVQNLSLLIGFLEWVRPAAGNYQLCRRMRLIIKRILDQILNPSPSSSAPTASQESIQSSGQNFDTASANGIVSFDPAGFDSGNFEDGLDNLDWLNNVDWSRGPWIDLGGQDFSAAPRWS